MAVRIEKFIFLYLILALINTPKLWILSGIEGIELLDWYINDFTFLFRLSIVFAPLALGVSIDAKMYWNNKREYFWNLVNRGFFIVLLITNFITLFADYSKLNDDQTIDTIILIPKTLIIMGLLLINWNIITTYEE